MELITSSHTSFAAARAAATLPLAALLQIASTLLLASELSVGARLITDLHSVTAAASWAALMGPLGMTLVGGAAEEVVAAAVLVVAAGVLAVEPLVVELPPLPQPQISAEHSTTPASSWDRLATIESPRVKKALARGRAAGGGHVVGED